MFSGRCSFLRYTANARADEPIGTKRIALSYDDAPRGDGPRFSGQERTAALLEQFEKASTGPVAMFVTTRGMNSRSGKQRVLDYAGAGHILANHSDRHMWASRTPVKSYVADIDRASKKLEGLPNLRSWYRFPFLDEGVHGEENKDGVRRDALRAALDERGLMNGYVTVDTYDWHLEDLWRDAVKAGRSVDMNRLSDVYVAMVVDAGAHYDAMSLDVLGRRPAHVLLLHENDLAASFTVDLANALRAEGWTIISPDEAYADPIAQQIPETLFSGMGRIAALAADSGLSGAEIFDHWSASTEGIEQKVAASGVFSSPDQ